MLPHPPLVCRPDAAITAATAALVEERGQVQSKRSDLERISKRLDAGKNTHLKERKRENKCTRVEIKGVCGSKTAQTRTLT